MKKSNFVVSEQEIVDPRKNYQLITDLKQGFKLARRNNQTMLAMEYLEKILDIIDERLPSNETKPETVVDKPVAKPRVAKATETGENES